MANRRLAKEIIDKKERIEKEKRELYLTAQQKITKLRRDKEKEIIRSV